MTIQKIQRVSSLVEEVCKRLSDEVALRLAAGEEFLPPERLLAEQLGVSRPVVREATIRLELQGLVEIQHGIGTRVVQQLHKPLIASLMLLVPEEVERQRQLQETRRAIEPEAAAMAAERITQKELDRLWAIHRHLEEAQSPAEAIECDLEFHRTIAECSGNLMFRLILDSLADIGRECRQLTIGRIGKEKAVVQHLPILQALEKHDAVAARQAMQTHLEAAQHDMTAGHEVTGRKPPVKSGAKRSEARRANAPSAL